MDKTEFLSNLDAVKMSKLIGLISYKDLEVDVIKKVSKLKRSLQNEEKAFIDLRDDVLKSYEVEEIMGVRDFSKHENREEIAEKLSDLGKSSSKISSEDLKSLTKDVDFYELAKFYDAETFDFILSLVE